MKIYRKLTKSYIEGVLDTLTLLRMKLPIEQAKGLAHYGTDILHEKGIVVFDEEKERYKLKKDLVILI